MKKKIFSRGLFVEGLRQLRLTGIIFLAAMLVIGMAIPVIAQISYMSYSVIYAETLTPEVVDFQSMCFMIVLLPFVVAPVFTFVLFGAFNKRSASDFYHSLPYTRVCMFNSFTAAILTALLAIAIIFSGVTMITYACMPHLFIISLSSMGDVLLTVLAQTLMVVFAVIMAMSITGTLVANVTCAGLILFLPRLLITMVSLTLGELAPIIEGHYGIFSMKYNVIWGVFDSWFNTGMNSYSDNIPCDIYSLVVAVCYGVIALLLFMHRKSETAGHAAPGKRTQSVIRICVGFLISSCVTCGLIMDFEIAMAIILYPFALIAYFAYELITQKTFRTIPKTIPGLFVLIGLNILIVVFCVGGSAVVHSYVPAAEEVQAIYIEADEVYSDYDVSFDDYAAEKAASAKIEDKRAIGLAVKALKESTEASEKGRYWHRDSVDSETGETTFRTMTVTYVSELGIRRTRNIRISSDDYAAIFEAISENDEYKKEFVELPEAINRTITVHTTNFWITLELSDEALYEVYESVRAEVKELDFAEWMSYLDGGNGGEFEFWYKVEGDSRTINLSIDPDILPKSCELLVKKANAAVADEIEKVYDALADYNEVRDDYNYFNLMMVCDEWELSYFDENDMDDVLLSDLKRLGEEMKETEFDASDYLTVNIEYSVETEDEFYREEWKSHVVFLPKPENFEPESDLFYVFDDQWEEDYEIKYEYID